jgi:hypothetical protein
MLHMIVFDLQLWLIITTLISTDVNLLRDQSPWFCHGGDVETLEIARR